MTKIIREKLFYPGKTLTMEDIGHNPRIDPFHHSKKDPLGVFMMTAYIPEIIEDIMDEELDPRVTIPVEFSDGEICEIDSSQIIFNIMFWRVFLALKLPVYKKHYYHIDNLVPDTFASIFTAMTPRCLNAIPSDDDLIRKRLYILYYDTFAVFQNWCIKYTGKYVSSINYLEACALITQPDIKPICDMTPLSIMENTKDVEIRISQKIDKFLDVVKNNYRETSLYKRLATDSLNKNQLAQAYIAYGPRSDIDDTILGKPIRSSTIRGLQHISEFALESLASKKSARYNAFMVADSSYVNRKGHLAVSEIYKIRKKPCSNKKTRSVYIERNKSDRYIGKIIKIDKEDVYLTKKNIKDFEGNYVNMVSALDCNYKGDVCVRCLGRMHEFIAGDFHLGLIVSTELFSKVVQKILSAKHLVKTFTIPYIFTPEMQQWLNPTVNGFSIKALPKGWKIGINKNYMINPQTINSSDLDEIDISELGGSVPEMLIIDDSDNIVDVINFDQAPNNPSIPYLTKKFLSYCCDNKSSITIKDDHQIIPIEKWRNHSVMFNIDVVNYDMTSYVDNISKFIETRIATYTDAGKALEELTKLVYTKTEIHISLIEVFLRALLIAGPDDYNFPGPDREEDVFGKLENVISYRSFTSRLVFEKLFTKDDKNSMLSPESYYKDIAAGFLAPFFGLD